MIGRARCGPDTRGSRPRAAPSRDPGRVPAVSGRRADLRHRQDAQCAAALRTLPTGLGNYRTRAPPPKHLASATGVTLIYLVGTIFPSGSDRARDGAAAQPRISRPALDP